MTGTLPELHVPIPSDPQTQLIDQLTSVTGIGEAHAKRLIEQGVTSLQDLREKVSDGTIKWTHHM